MDAGDSVCRGVDRRGEAAGGDAGRRHRLRSRGNPLSRDRKGAGRGNEINSLATFRLWLIQRHCPQGRNLRGKRLLFDDL